MWRKKKNNNVVHLRLPCYSKEFVHVVFCVFQTNLNKAANIFCKLSEWIRNIHMIQCFSSIKTWIRILRG